MKEELIRILEENNFSKRYNGRQEQYIKEHKMDLDKQCQLFVIANKQPILFYEITKGERYTDNFEIIFTHGFEPTIEKAIEIIKAFDCLNVFYELGKLREED